ncbi:hypothetical protein ACIBF6_32560 [Streptosporangium amethystogenes]|uniref:hypothetical protein n=1 Tax=Streptosporangium amethystogenes TaxID=2002 RepID=UPI00378DF037
MSDLRRGQMLPYRPPGTPETRTPVVAPPSAGDIGPMTRPDRLHRAVTRGDPAIPEAACCLTTNRRSGRLDAERAVPVDQADPALPCPVGGCRMRAWPPVPQTSR